MISTLPKTIRDQLNQRLESGEPETPLLEWLNGLPEVQEMLQTEFPGASISEKDLAQWKQEDYPAWLERQETTVAMQTMVADVEELTPAGAEPPAELLAQWLAFRYVTASRSLQETTGEPGADWRRLRDFCADVATLRRLDHTAARLRLDREKFEHDTREFRAKEEQAEWRQNHKGQLSPETIRKLREAVRLL